MARSPGGEGAGQTYRLPQPHWLGEAGELAAPWPDQQRKYTQAQHGRTNPSRAAFAFSGPCRRSWGPRQRLPPVILLPGCPPPDVPLGPMAALYRHRLQPLPALQPVEGENVIEVGVVTVNLGFGFDSDSIGA